MNDKPVAVLLYSCFDEPEELHRDPAAALDEWIDLTGEPPAAVTEWSAYDNTKMFPDGRSVAEHLAEQAAECMGALFDEVLTTCGEGAGAEAIDAALGHPDVVALLDEAMKLAASMCRFHVADQELRRLPVTLDSDGGPQITDPEGETDGV